MIALAPGARVYLACGITDMRNYVASPVMRSPPPKQRPKRPFAGMVEPNRSA
jgi:hypothetical protein